MAIRCSFLTIVCAGACGPLAANAHASAGELTEKPGATGCVAETPAGPTSTCADGVGLDGVTDAVISPDSKSAYAVSATGNSVAIFDRDPETGDLTQKAGADGCVAETASGPTSACADGVALLGPTAVGISADGASVYVASRTSSAVAIFDRDATTGELTQKVGVDGCVAETATGATSTCADGVALFQASSLTLSGDGRTAYATSRSLDAISIFDRDPATGELTQKAGAAGCVAQSPDGPTSTCAAGVALDSARGVALAPDDRSLYVASATSDAVAIFDRDPADGELTQKAGTAGCVAETATGATSTCTDGVALDAANFTGLSDDGRSLYVASDGSDAVAIFDRDLQTGEVTQKAGAAGCVAEAATGATSTCADGVALDAPSRLAISADGASVHVASGLSNAVANFGRSPVDGGLTQLAGTAGCVAEAATGATSTCADGVGLEGADAAAVTPDGAQIYVAGNLSDAVATFDRDSGLGLAEISQEPGPAGCTAELPGGATSTCKDGVGLDDPNEIELGPDGRSAYAVSLGASHAVTVFTRDPASGELTQKAGTAGCISASGTGGACQIGRELLGASAVAISPDGRSAYVAGLQDGGVAIFDRDPTTGELTQKPGTPGCVSSDGSGGTCQVGVLKGAPSDVLVSDDGRTVYVIGLDGGVSVFDRNPASGELTQKPGAAGCVGSGGCTPGLAFGDTQSAALSSDGRSLYVTSQFANAIAILDRDPATGELTQKPGSSGCIAETPSGATSACTDGVGLSAPESIKVSRDGSSVYSAARISSAVAVFDRNPDTGALVQKPGTAGCISAFGSAGACQVGEGLNGVETVTITVDDSVYAAGNAVAFLDRDPSSGALSQAPGTAGCIAISGAGCQSGFGVGSLHGVAASPDGRSIYLVSAFTADAILTLRRGVPPQVTLTDSDPDSPANDNSPEIKGTAEPGSTVSLYSNVGCTGTPLATGTAADFASPGFTVAVPNNSTTNFRATAQGATGTSICSSPLAYVEDSTPPADPASLSTNPPSPANDNNPSVSGTATVGATTIRVFSIAGCTGTPLATGSVAAFESTGIPVGVVADDSETTFRVRAVDQAGNQSICSTASVTYIEDSTAPSAPTLETSPPSPSNFNNPAIFDASFGPAEGQIFRNSTCAGAPEVSGPGVLSGTPVSVADDSSTDFSAISVDAAGNQSPCSDPITYVEDSTAPEAPSITTTDPESPANDNFPAVIGTSGTGSPATQVLVFEDFDCSAPVEQGTVADFTGAGITIEVDDDSSTALSALAIDEAGNFSLCSNTITYVEDSIAPAPPSISSTDPASPANDNDPEVIGTVGAGSPAQVRVFTNSSCSPAAAQSGPAATFTGAGISVNVANDSSTPLSTATIDEAGNQSTCSNSLTYVEDSTSLAPTGIVTDPVGPANDNTPEVRGSGAEAGSTVRVFTTVGCSGAATATAGPAAFQGPGITIPVADDSTTTFRVTATDAVGNVSPCASAAAYVEDSTAPAPPAITATSPASPADDNDPELIGTVGTGSPTQVRVFKSSSCLPAAAQSAPVATFTGAGISVSVLNDSTTPLSTATIDQAGNQSTCSNSLNYVEDSITPDTELTGGPGGFTTDTTPTFSFSSPEPAVSFECAIDAGAFAACAGPGPTHTASPLALGAHIFRVRAKDAAGHTDASPAELLFAVQAAGASPPPPDTDPPETTITKGPKKKSASKKASFEFSSDEAGSRFECSLDKAAFAPCASPASLKVKKGKHTLAVRAIDVAANADTTPALHTWKVKKPKR